jgi:hypothetical protein
MAIGDFVDKAKDMAKDQLDKTKGDVGNAQDEASKEVNGSPQGTDHSNKSAGDAADKAADSVKNQVNKRT